MAKGTRLESVRGESLRGFKSHPFRQTWVHRRRSPAAVFHQIEGGSQVDIEGTPFTLAEADTCCAPGYSRVTLKNRSTYSQAYGETKTPVTVDGRFVLRGSVDLIERSEDGARLRVTDHKTGRNRSTADLVVGGGAVLQPVLYGLVVEAMLQVPVRQGRLFYCTRRPACATWHGRGRRGAARRRFGANRCGSPDFGEPRKKELDHEGGKH